MKQEIKGKVSTWFERYHKRTNLLLAEAAEQGNHLLVGACEIAIRLYAPREAAARCPDRFKQKRLEAMSVADARRLVTAALMDGEKAKAS